MVSLPREVQGVTAGNFAPSLQYKNAATSRERKEGRILLPGVRLQQQQQQPARHHIQRIQVHSDASPVALLVVQWVEIKAPLRGHGGGYVFPLFIVLTFLLLLLFHCRAWKWFRRCMYLRGFSVKICQFAG